MILETSFLTFNNRYARKTLFVVSELIMGDIHYHMFCIAKTNAW